MLDIFQARRAVDHSVTEKLHQTSFLKARVLLLYNCPNSSSQNPIGHRSWCRCVNRGGCSVHRMAGNRLRPRGGSSVLRSPILKWRPNLRVLPSGSKRLCVSSRSIARRQPRPFRSECRRKTEVDMFKSKAPENDKNAAANAAEVV